MGQRSGTTLDSAVSIRTAIELPPVQRGVPEVLSGEEQLGRPIRWAHACEIPDIASTLQGGELLLTTGLGIDRDDRGQRRFIDDLADRSVAGLIVELWASLRPAAGAPGRDGTAARASAHRAAPRRSVHRDHRADPPADPRQRVRLAATQGRAPRPAVGLDALRSRHRGGARPAGRRRRQSRRSRERSSRASSSTRRTDRRRPASSPASRPSGEGFPGARRRSSARFRAGPTKTGARSSASASRRPPRTSTPWPWSGASVISMMLLQTREESRVARR